MVCIGALWKRLYSNERVFNVLERKRRKRREKERERNRERERNEGIDACFVQVVAWYKNILDTVLTTRSPTLDSWTFISRILNDYTRSREIRVENRSRKGTILQEISSLAVIRYYYLLKSKIFFDRISSRFIPKILLVIPILQECFFRREEGEEEGPRLFTHVQTTLFYS